MNKHQHHTNNAVLGAPAGWDQAELPCAALPITRINIEGMAAVVSYWKPSENELAILATGGSAALTLLGVTMPPAMLAVDPEWVT
jgi:hypothetical protein